MEKCKIQCSNGKKEKDKYQSLHSVGTEINTTKKILDGKFTK
ncbi:Hypothetical protein ADU73_0621 [Pediococcus damnosus]|nr:Hypothetical protein ADU73_0621 [Pediococcus damnosus]